MGKPPLPGNNATPADEADEALDEALDESFPASDPVAIHIDPEATDVDAPSPPRVREDPSPRKR